MVGRLLGWMDGLMGCRPTKLAAWLSCCGIGYTATMLTRGAAPSSAALTTTTTAGAGASAAAVADADADAAVTGVRRPPPTTETNAADTARWLPSFLFFYFFSLIIIVRPQSVVKFCEEILEEPAISSGDTRRLQVMVAGERADYCHRSWIEEFHREIYEDKNLGGSKVRERVTKYLLATTEGISFEYDSF